MSFEDFVFNYRSRQIRFAEKCLKINFELLKASAQTKKDFFLVSDPLLNIYLKKWDGLYHGSKEAKNVECLAKKRYNLLFLEVKFMNVGKSKAVVS